MSERGTGIALVLAGAVAAAVYMVTKATGGVSAQMQAFAAAIGVAEGFGTPGAIPTVRHNPGDLIIPPDTSVTTYQTDDAGWQALYHQLELIRDRESAYYTPAMSIAQMANVWTATAPSDWANNVAVTLGASVDDPISNWLV